MSERSRCALLVQAVLLRLVKRPPMTTVEALAWLVLAFADGPACLIQGSFHWLPDGRVFVREDGCAIQSQQEGTHVLFWSNDKWVLIPVPNGARSLTYRWGCPVAFVNGDRVKIQTGMVVPSGQER